MIYTCYEMIRDCRANRAQGWSYLISTFTPAIERLLAHYYPDAAGPQQTTQFLRELCTPAHPLWASLDPVPERIFLAHLRQHLAAAAPSQDELDLDTLQSALETLTVTEKQSVWLETMHYPAADAARMLRMDTATVEKIRARAAELLRGHFDHWSRTLLNDHGPALGRAAARISGAECLEPSRYLDVIDGRTTWQVREQMDRHIATCLYCLDHFCRIHEVVDVMRTARPLDEAAAAQYRRQFGIPDPQPAAAWPMRLVKRLRG